MGLGHMSKVYTPIPNRRKSKKNDSGVLGKDFVLATAAAADDNGGSSSGGEAKPRESFSTSTAEDSRKPAVQKSTST